jgi:Tol biopolymer transport system component/DNA-binding winged helix-turn-helix (wHTH) protein
LDGNFRVGQWLVQPQLNLIQGPGEETSVEPKAMDVLVCLAKQAGEVVAKERLMQTVWSDTFVTDEVLTNSIWELRKAFQDDAKNPKVIQTVFKKGYRLIASVSFEDGKSAPGHPRVERDFEQAKTKPTASILWCIAGVAFALFAGVALSLWFSNQSSVSTLPPQPVPLTSLRGSEIQPALSPDGNQVAFAWNGQKEENYDIYLKVIGSETMVPLSTDPANDLSPAWSPDGRLIAFLRQSGGQQTIVIVPALGGPERALYSSAVSIQPGFYETRLKGRNLSWSPDGRFLAVSERHAESRENQIIVVSVEAGEKRILRSSASDSAFEYPNLGFSPDGQFLAFSGSAGPNLADIYLVPFSTVKPKRLTFAPRPVHGLDWTSDGEAIIFSRRDPTGFHLWRIAISRPEPERLTWIGEGSVNPSFSRRQNSMAYVQVAYDTNIWKFELPASARQAVSSPVVSSTREEGNPKFSPDGKRILFTSNRSGKFEIWVCASDGSNPVQLISFDGAEKGSPRWSPDGGAIAFDGLSEGQRDIYIANILGGKVTRLTKDKSQEVRPSWSRDGRWIYFGSNRTGEYQIWKAPSTGGEAVQVTRQGGREALESPDGKFVYYSLGRETSGLWRISVEGGAKTKILDDPRQGYWDLTGHGIYLLVPGSPNTLKFYRFKATQTEELGTVEGEIPWSSPGFSVSPDGRQILVNRLDRLESDLMLVENFR